MKAGFVNIIGAPNVGKSTLLNQLVGSKVSIISPKVQTTRVAIKGIVSVDQTQLVFIDTPGIFQKASTPLEKRVLNNAMNNLGYTDFTLFVISATKIKPEDEYVLKLLPPHKVIGVINKSDLVPSSALPQLAKTLWDYNRFDEIFAISALKNKGITELKQFLAKNAPDGPWHYPEDYATTASSRFIASEIVREKLYHYLHQELPYNLAVIIEKWEEDPFKIYASIYVARPSYKAMVVGDKAQLIKKVGIAARLELQKIFNCKLSLFLYVKVHENWLQDQEVCATMQNPE